MGLFDKSNISSDVQKQLEIAESYLGKEIREKVSGFQGTVTGYARYLYGCTVCLVVPKVDKDGKAPTGEWYDMGRLEIIGEGVTKEAVASPDGHKGGTFSGPHGAK